MSAAEYLDTPLEEVVQEVFVDDGYHTVVVIYEESPDGPLLQGSLALAGFKYGEHRGEVFDPMRDGSRRGDHDVEVVVHASPATDAITVGFEREEVEDLNNYYGQSDKALVAVLAVKAIKRIKEQ